MGIVNIDTKGIGSLIGGIGGLAKDIRSAITGEISPEKKAEIEIKIKEIEAQANAGQQKVNEIEAQHPSLFVAGWRPFVGWVCGTSLAYNFIANPIIEWIVKLAAEINPKTGEFINIIPPKLDTASLITVLLGLLGMGGLRTYEKFKGVNRKH